MNAQIRNIDVYDVGNLARFAANLNLTNNLLEHTLLFANAFRLANEMKRHSNLNLLTFHQPGKIGMEEPAAHRVDLALVKHHLTSSNAFNVEREDCVTAGLRAKYRCQVS